MIKLKKLLKENLTWNNRKFGQKLPTVADYKEAYNKKHGITEEEQLNEVGISVSSKPFDAWREHGDYCNKLNRDSMWAAKAFPNKKKEAMEIKKITQKLNNLIEIIKGQAIDL
jgi:hypothetical protein